MKLDKQKQWTIILGLVLLFAATFVIPAFIFSQKVIGEIAINSVMIPLWAIGILAGLSYILLGVTKDASRRIAMGAGALLLLLLKIVNPLKMRLDGSWDMNGYITGVPYFGDGCSLLMGVFTVIAISGIVIVLIKKDFNVKDFFLQVLVWIPVAIIAGILDGLSANYFTQVVRAQDSIFHSAIFTRLLAFFIQLFMGIIVGFNIFRTQKTPLYARITIIVMGFLALARIVLVLQGDLFRNIIGYYLMVNFYQSAAVNGLLIAASILCLKRAQANKQIEQPV